MSPQEGFRTSALASYVFILCMSNKYRKTKNILLLLTNLFYFIEFIALATIEQDIKLWFSKEYV